MYNFLAKPPEDPLEIVVSVDFKNIDLEQLEVILDTFVQNFQHTLQNSLVSVAIAILHGFSPLISALVIFLATMQILRALFESIR